MTHIDSIPSASPRGFPYVSALSNKLTPLFVRIFQLDDRLLYVVFIPASLATVKHVFAMSIPALDARSPLAPKVAQNP